MTPTKTLLEQLRGEVKWLWEQLMIANFYHGDQGHDHANAALDIIEELEGREAICQECIQEGDWTGLAENKLARLYNLIKGCAPREAMELLEGMMEVKNERK